MHEVWLALNRAYELALSALPLVTVVAGSWLALMWAARDGLSARQLPLALGVGLLAAVVAALAVPPLTGASLADMGYWLDWASLAAVALGFGAVVALLAWPVVCLLRQPALPPVHAYRVQRRATPVRPPAAAGRAAQWPHARLPGRRQSGVFH
jgi:NO-binding membrane sensor protein with MHYT domain